MDDFEYLRFLGWAQGGLRLGQGGRGSQKSNFCSRDETKLMSGVSYYRRCTCTCNYCGCWPVLGPPWSHTWPALALPWLHPGPALGAGPTWALEKMLALDGPPDRRLRRLFPKKNLQRNLQIFAKNGPIFGSIRVLEPPGWRPVQGPS